MLKFEVHRSSNASNEHDRIAAHHKLVEEIEKWIKEHFHDVNPFEVFSHKGDTCSAFFFVSNELEVVRRLGVDADKDFVSVWECPWNWYCNNYDIKGSLRPLHTQNTVSTNSQFRCRQCNGLRLN